jgi:hypothetical protein
MRWELCFQQLLELGASNHVASSSSFVCQPRVSPHAALSSALIPSFASLRTALSCSGASPELHTQAPPVRSAPSADDPERWPELHPCAPPSSVTPELRSCSGASRRPYVHVSAAGDSLGRWQGAAWLEKGSDPLVPFTKCFSIFMD